MSENVIQITQSNQNHYLPR